MLKATVKGLINPILSNYLRYTNATIKFQFKRRDGTLTDVEA